MKVALNKSVMFEAVTNAYANLMLNVRKVKSVPKMYVFIQS